MKRVLKTPGTLVLLGLIVLGGAVTAASLRVAQSRQRDPDVERPALLERLRTPKTLEETKEWILGDWTAVAYFNDGDSEIKRWFYVRFERNSRAVWCTALPADDAWSKCKNYKYIVKEAGIYADGPVYDVELQVQSDFNPHFRSEGVELDYFDYGHSSFEFRQFKRGNKHPRAKLPKLFRSQRRRALPSVY